MKYIFVTLLLLFSINTFGQDPVNQEGIISFDTSIKKIWGDEEITYLPYYGNKGFEQNTVIKKNTTSHNREGFSLSAGLSYGMIFDQRESKNTFYQGSFNTTQSHTFAGGLFSLGTREMTALRDTIVEPFIGGIADLRLFNNSQVSFHVNAQALLGTEGRRLFGGGLSLDVWETEPTTNYSRIAVTLTGNVYQEYRTKELRIDLGIEIPIVQP